MKTTLLKNFILLFILSIATSSLTSCKKDQIVVDKQQTFMQDNYVNGSGSIYSNPYRLTLEKNGVSDFLPGGDIVWRGTYKINGSKIKVTTDNEVFEFTILSPKKIKEKKYGVELTLQE